jgi:glutamine synthetase
MQATKLGASEELMLQKYTSLPALGDSVQAEYIWIGGSGLDIRSKTRTLPRYPASVTDIPMWNFDGSSTGQAEGSYSEIMLRPVYYVRDPLRAASSLKRDSSDGKCYDNILVLCECLDAETMKADKIKLGKAISRHKAEAIFNHPTAQAARPWFGIEQEYTLFDARSVCRRPLGWPQQFDAYPAAQGKYYCGVGADAAFGRAIAEAHYRCCLYAGLNISGINAEVMPGQWEYQIGPVEGIEAGDQVWVSRYLLQRVAEDFGAVVSFAPKPVAGEWNGAGLHTNFSTLVMRTEDGRKGFEEVITAVKRFEKRHIDHMRVYGEDNDKRMTGKCETSSYTKFTYGVANRGASVRIPRQTELDGYGYLEDRRPAANADPYAVTAIITETALDLVDEFIEWEKGLLEDVAEDSKVDTPKEAAKPILRLSDETISEDKENEF